MALAACILLACAGTSPSGSLADAVRPYFDVLGLPDEIFPGTTMRFHWGMHEPIVLVVQYEPEGGWRVVALYQDMGAVVPPEWVVIMVIARRDRPAAPTDPWGNPITDMNVLDPTQR